MIVMIALLIFWQSHYLYKDTTFIFRILPGIATVVLIKVISQFPYYKLVCPDHLNCRIYLYMYNWVINYSSYTLFFPTNTLVINFGALHALFWDFFFFLGPNILFKYFLPLKYVNMVSGNSTYKWFLRKIWSSNLQSQAQNKIK